MGAPLLGILILLAPGFETLEVMTPVDYLRLAKIPITTASVGVPGLVVTDTSGITHVCDARFQDVMNNDYDGVIVPGGMPGTLNIIAESSCLQLIKKYNSEGKLVASICAATGYILAEACQILKGKRAVGYPGTDDKITQYGGIKLTTPTCVDGNIITSRGPGTSIQFALELIKYISGEEAAKEVAKDTVTTY